MERRDFTLVGASVGALAALASVEVVSADDKERKVSVFDDVDVNGKLKVTRDVKFDQNLHVTGKVEIAGDLVVRGRLIVNGVDVNEAIGKTRPLKFDHVLLTPADNPLAVPTDWTIGGGGNEILLFEFKQASEVLAAWFAASTLKPLGFNVGVLRGLGPEYNKKQFYKHICVVFPGEEERRAYNKRSIPEPVNHQINVLYY